jgi:Ca-activated chloride channel homolog
MNESKLLPDDPKLTAYALGELDGAERAAVEAAVGADPALRAAVDDIRALAAQLETALAQEPAPELSDDAVALPASLAAVRAAKPAAAPAKLLRFPQLYYVVGGLAAACFAVLLAVLPERKLGERRVYKEIALSSPAVEPPAPSGLLQSVVEEHAAREADESGRVAVLAAHQTAAGARMAKTEAVALAMPAMMTSDFNTESYAWRAESDFLSARENPLSTFSADVDTASYANVRRFLRQGRRPPVDAVRIEELVNYFPYRYAPPADGAPLAASMEVAEAPWEPAHRLVRIGLKGRDVALGRRGAANLVFLLDVSGSMATPNKLPLVKESLRLLLGRLRPDDRVAIVTYAGASGLALPSTPVARAGEIAAALDELAPGGSTNGARGIELAYDIAKANFVAGGVNRVVLCTDGDFNVGVTNEGDLHRLITEKAKSGVFLTALGFGMGNYQDATLQRLADAGNGNYGYIDTRREAEKLLVEQVGGTLVTIAKDVKLQVEFNPAKVARYRLIGYEKRRLNREDFNNDAVDAGEIGAGHTVTALYEIVPAGAEAAAEGAAPAVDALKYQSVPAERVAGGVSPVSGDELLTLKVRYKDPDGSVSRKLEFALVDRGTRFADASEDFQFTAAVAGFGMILRDSPHKGDATLAKVAQWAERGTGADAGGYRAEFRDLVRRAETLVQ